MPEHEEFDVAFAIGAARTEQTAHDQIEQREEHVPPLVRKTRCYRCCRRVAIGVSEPFTLMGRRRSRRSGGTMGLAPLPRCLIDGSPSES
jgi:hypothetical protein